MNVVIETALEKTARLLATSYDISVVFEEGKCCTDGKTIYLPPLPPNADPKFIEAVHGFLDHEAAHVLFTDFSLPEVKNLTEHEFSCVNVVEDLRIERKMIDLFPGSEANLAASQDFVERKTLQNPSILTPFFGVLAAAHQCLRYGRRTLFDLLTPELQTLTTDVVSCINKYTLITTGDSVVAGLEVYSLIEHLITEAERHNSATSANNTGLTSTKKISDPNPIAISNLSKDLLAEAQNGLLGKPSEAGYQHDCPSDSTYVVYSTAGDTVEVLTEASSTSLSRVRNTTDPVVSVMKARLLNSLRATNRGRWVSNKEEGKLDSRKLYRVMMGTSSVYKTLQNKTSVNTAVLFLIDHSGSMRNERLRLAGEAAIAIGDVLTPLRIPFAVYGFSTKKATSRTSNLEPYARWNSLWIGQYKTFDGSWEPAAQRLSVCERNLKNNTLDGESLLFGARQLLRRPEKRKILFIFNDGKPEPGDGDIGRCQKYLHRVIAGIGELGIEVVGFGINSDDIAEYYPDHVIIRKLSDLTKEPLVKLDAMLRKGLR